MVSTFVRVVHPVLFFQVRFVEPVPVKGSTWDP
jgi:hypothetical protein